MGNKAVARYISMLKAEKYSLLHAFIWYFGCCFTLLVLSVYAA